MKPRLSAAISYSLLFKAWQAAAGLVTIPIVIHFLEPALQGYYYTFASLIALQSFFELGFGIVISVYASHEWVKLRLDASGRIAGDARARSRIVSLGHFVFRYFGLAALIYLFVIAAIGANVLSRHADPTIDWRVPFILHISFSAISLWLMPFLSLMEGCNQVAVVARFRLFQSLLANAALWAALAAGGTLWSVPIFSALNAALLAGFLLISRRGFFGSLLEPPAGDRISWRDDLLPMQWRLGVQALFSYMTFPLYTLLAYTYFGAIEAGRMGMTLQIVAGVQSFSLVMITAKAPELAMLAASNDRGALAANWRRWSKLALGTMTAAFALLLLLQISDIGMLTKAIGRVLPPGVCAALAAGALIAGVIQCIAVYLRAYRREILTPVGVSSGVLYGLSAWWLGAHFGATGMAFSYVAVTALVALPVTLRILGRSGHALQLRGP
jgi:hypothetical protein